jgi:5-methylcytosine-specific restriction protein A
MPIQPPSLRRPGATDRKAWQQASIYGDKRKRGRAGQRDRARVLAEEPLCRACLELGRTSASTRVDHIKPLSEGGSDERFNKQGLCIPCHDAKSAAERVSNQRGRTADR